MKKFIYVLSKEDRDKLLELGYTLFKSDEKNDVFVFINEERLAFQNTDVRYVLQDTIVF